MIKKYILTIAGVGLAASTFLMGENSTQPTTFSPRVLYVSPSANEGGTGTLENPFRTIQKARDFIRHAKTGKCWQWVVQIRGGTYVLDETIQFTPEDSALDGGSITYAAYPEEKPILSGGQKISGWKPHENGVWKAEVGKMQFRQLYVNGATAIRARHPQQGNFFRLTSADKDGCFVTVPSALIPKTASREAPEMHVSLLWAEAILRIKNVVPDPDKPDFSRLTFQDPEGKNVFKREWPRFVDNQAFHLENAIEFLDAPGEWWLNTESGTLYYLPKAGENMENAEVIAPRLETLVAVRGTNEQRVSGLKFSGLTFSHTNWTRPSGGHLNTQAGFYYVAPEEPRSTYSGRMPGAFEEEFTDQIRIERCIFTQLGATGLDIREGSTGNRVEGNVFYDIAGGGIMLGGFTTPDIEPDHPLRSGKHGKVSAENIIANNYIRHIGTSYPGCCGIAAGFVRDTVIENNEIFDLPYTGISVGWGWSAKPSGLRDNTIRFNLIHNVMRELTDGAGIYTLSLQPGTQIYRNHLHTIRTSPMSHDPHVNNGAIGIYCDEGSGGTAGKPFIIRENFLNACSMSYHFHVVATIIFDGNSDYFNDQKSQRYPGKFIADQAGITSKYADILKSTSFAPFVVNTEDVRKISTQLKIQPESK